MYGHMHQAAVDLCKVDEDHCDAFLVLCRVCTISGDDVLQEAIGILFLIRPTKNGYSWSDDRLFLRVAAKSHHRASFISNATTEDFHTKTFPGFVEVRSRICAVTS